ncbi:SRPBCC family protein [Nitrosopumilus sp.]|uniref:SRPBCC family protein n=1 Tax=Nitrosopumilus sp. TaxID=2024843 RepID=UPI00292E469B|nr:SRPBCC family protein [Nitrosopumilus sp.]
MDIKKELVINASTSRVYDAITDMRQLSQWFPDVISIEPKVGGKVVFRSPNSLSNISDTIEGKIIKLEKNKKLTYTWFHPDVPNFPLMRVSWNLEQMEKNKTRVMIVHSGFVDDNTVNSYNKRWVRIIEHLDVFAVSKKPANIQKQIAFVMIPISLSLIVMVAGGGLQNSDKFVSGFF